MEGHSGRVAYRRDFGSVGAGLILAGFLPDGQPAFGDALGAARGSCSSGDLLRMFHRQRAPGSCIVERGYKLRRGDAFIFADLIVLPILNIYRKYYGGKVSLFLLGIFYAAMVAAGLVIDLAFRALGLIPDERNAKVMEASIEHNYTTVPNAIFLALAAVLVWRFFRTGGPEMLKEM